MLCGKICNCDSVISGANARAHLQDYVEPCTPCKAARERERERDPTFEGAHITEQSAFESHIKNRCIFFSYIWYALTRTRPRAMILTCCSNISGPM